MKGRKPAALEFKKCNSNYNWIYRHTDQLLARKYNILLLTGRDSIGTRVVREIS